MDLNILLENSVKDMKVLDEVNEMKRRFEKRTMKHIERVIENAKVISGSYRDLTLTYINASKHDQSKFKEPEMTPYIWLTECYRCRGKDLGFDYPVGMEKRTREATIHHITTNPHHPEYWDPNKSEIKLAENRDSNEQPQIVDATSMHDIYVAEMIADWVSMSQEKDTSTKEWADSNVNKRWSFNDHQIELIYKLIKLFEN